MMRFLNSKESKEFNIEVIGQFNSTILPQLEHCATRMKMVNEQKHLYLEEGENVPFVLCAMHA